MEMSEPVEVNKSRLSPDVTDNEIEELTRKVEELEREKKDIHDNYNVQRKKLQMLYIQKEEELKTASTQIGRLSKELDEAKSELCVAGIIKDNEVEAEKRKAEAEIATLNRLVQDTVEVSSTSQSEINKLKQLIQLLQSQVNKPKAERDKDKESLLLAPANMLSVTKTLARKVVGQLGTDNDLRPQDNLEDSMKKAQEGADVLRSFIVPLEKTIQELTEKLTMTQQRLRKYEEVGEDTEDRRKQERSLVEFNSSQDSGSIDADQTTSDLIALSPSRIVPCDMCVNYEAQLVAQQQSAKALVKQKECLENSLQRFSEDLVKEKQIRKDMEDQWNEKKEEHKTRVEKLKADLEHATAKLHLMETEFAEFCATVKGQLNKLTYDREEVSQQLELVQKENDALVGKHSKNAARLREEVINFPDNVADLHELLLKFHEDLITSQVAKETCEELVETLRCELQLVRDQMESCYAKESNLAAETAVVRKELEAKEKERARQQHLYQEIVNSSNKYKNRMLELEEKCNKLLEEKKACEEKSSVLKSRVASLQQELDTSETVQKDFVRLSQSLQIELEKIRGADAEVRWQHEEDVEDCGGCRTPFTGSKKKVHCRHCGRIYCQTCLGHVVLSGPKQRSSHVCQVCHTLLNKETAPYFSHEPPPVQ